MRHAIVLAPQAAEDLRLFDAHHRSMVKAAIKRHLRHEPAKVSRSRIKRLQGLSQPQFRLRADDIRVFYDVAPVVLEVLAIEPKPTAGAWLSRGETRMKTVALSEVKDDLSCYLRIAEKERVVITRHGKPAGVLIGFESEDDWFDYKLEHDARFLRRIETARRSIRAGRGAPVPSGSSRRPRLTGWARLQPSR
jgi:prevent-host-death family protein